MIEAVTFPSGTQWCNEYHCTVHEFSAVNYRPAMLRPWTTVVGAPKAVGPMALGRWLLSATAVISFKSW